MKPVHLIEECAGIGARGSCTLVVHGGVPLGGTVAASGSKQSLVTGVAAAAMGRAPVRIHNCPANAETRGLAALVRQLGGSADRTGSTLLLDGTGIAGGEPDPELAAAVHGSVYLAPALLARFGSVTMPRGGGSPIGAGPGGRRQVSHVVDVLGRFGATAWLRLDGGFGATADRLRPAEIDLLDYTTDRRARTGPHYSGATKLAVLTAVAAGGTSVLRNPYPKPEVADLVALLGSMGAGIEGGGEQIVVHGNPDLPGRTAECTLPPDLIEIVTWICAGATLCPDGLTVTGPGMRRACWALAPEIRALDAMGVPVEASASAITARPPEHPVAVDVTATSTGVHSASQPFLALLACAGGGPSRIRDTVWPNRFGYAEQLNRLGTDLRRAGDTLTVTGPAEPFRPGQRVSAPDLRSAAVLLLAALQVPGTTTVAGLHHLARGYPDLPGELVRLGARIEAP